jgi:hypothetical protein
MYGTQAALIENYVQAATADARVGDIVVFALSERTLVAQQVSARGSHFMRTLTRSHSASSRCWHSCWASCDCSMTRRDLLPASRCAAPMPT